MTTIYLFICLFIHSFIHSFVTHQYYLDIGEEDILGLAHVIFKIQEFKTAKNKSNTSASVSINQSTASHHQRQD